MSKLIIVIPDLQVPYHDEGYVRSTVKFVKAMRASRLYRSVEVIQIGDLQDQPEVGRWNKGAAGEYAGTFWASVAETQRIIKQYQFDKIKLGNHDLRVMEYITKYAPALGGPDSRITMEWLFEIDPKRTKLELKPFQMAPGWIAAHGHEGGLSPVSGRTAFNLVGRFDQSVVCGHTHRAGTISTTIGLPDARRRLTGMEVGHGMNEESATYIKHGSPNWQKGLGLFVVDRGRTYEHLIMMDSDNTFEWNGKVYRP